MLLEHYINDDVVRAIDDVEDAPTTLEDGDFEVVWRRTDGGRGRSHPTGRQPSRG
jgi:hypothetical protein